MMNKKIVDCFIILAAITLASKANAQPPEPSPDSLERKLMMDSLQVTALIANEILSVRDSFFARSNRIETDPSLSPTTKKILLMRQSSIANDHTREILGATKYLLYREMIQRRIDTHHLNGKASPLAGAGN